MTYPVKAGRRRTLFLSHVLPTFLGTGPQIRSAALVRMLAAREDVHVLVIHPRENILGLRDVEMEKLCGKIEMISLELHRDASGTSPEKIKVLEPIRRFYDENQLNSLFVFRLESCFYLTEGLDLFPRRYLDLDELASRRLHLIDNLRSVSTTPNPERTDRPLQTALRMKEKNLIPRFKKTFVSSEIEAVEVRRLTGSEQVHLLPNIFPSRSLLPPAEPKPREILFVGTFGHFPNIDAIRYFHGEIFPLIRRQLGEDILLRIVGHFGFESFPDLAQDPNVRLMGFQKDVEPFYADAALAIAPLRAGSGTRIKILEAFAYGRPVVSTSAGAAGLSVTDGENILLADDAEDFARACVKLVQTPDLAARLMAGGRRLHQELYSEEALLRLYDDAMAAETITTTTPATP